jgi:uridine kinase
MKMKTTFVISISGISGGGKTTITTELCKQLDNSIALYFDNYEYSKQPEDIGEWVESGSKPDDWDLTLLENDIERVLQSSEYDYLILDYPFGKKEYQIKKYIDTAIYIDTPLDVSLARRIIRDYKSATTDDIINELTCYLEHSRKYFIQPEDEMQSFNMIIDGALPINKIIDKIVIALGERKYL